MEMNVPRVNSEENSAPNPSSHQTRRPWLSPLILLAITASAAVAPMFFLGNASGHDFQFHLASWMEAASQWHQHIFFPRWAEWANFGFGEPRFVFYPPASWIVGAALGSALPWMIVPGTYIWLMLVLGGMGMWRFAREWLGGTEATAAALFYALNPYNLVLIYYRSDFAELLACALLPCLLLGALRVFREGWRGVPLLSLVFAAIWLSNAPAGVIATYSLALLIAVATIYNRSLRPTWIGACAMVVGFALAAFYIFPAAYEQHWVQISEVVKSNLAPERNFLFTHSDDPEFLLFNWKVSGVALLVILIVSLTAVFVARQRRRFPDVWWMLLALGSASTLLMFPISAVLWRHLPKLQFLQFPWRWLGPLGAVFACFVAAWWPQPKKQRITWAAVLSVMILLGVVVASDAWWDSEDVDHVSDGIQSGYGYSGTDEYAPLDSNIYDLPGWTADDTEPTGDPTPFVEQFDDASEKVVLLKNVTVHVDAWTAVHKSISIQAASPATLAIRLLNYPSWHVWLDGAASEVDTVPDTGEMLVAIPAGAHHLEIRFVRTPDRTAGGAISLIAAIGLLAFSVKQRASSNRTPAP